MERPITFRRGTFAEFQQLSPLDDNTLYFIEDIGKIYKGEHDVTAAFHPVSDQQYATLSTNNTLPGQFYVNQSSGGLKIREMFTDAGVTVDRIVELFPGMTALVQLIQSIVQPLPVAELTNNNHVLVSTGDTNAPIGESEYPISDLVTRWILF